MAKQIGRYTIVSELGRGGMGVVFKAWEESLQRHVAIKMLADQYSDDESVVARFMREARAVADVHHANIVQVFCVDTHDGQPYFVMEYVEGESLGDCIRRESKLHPRKAVSLLREAASGLSAAHARGVVHRDIKPANLMLSRHGGLKVVDFGIARVESPDTKLTATGMAMGTPAYLSPEVCLAKAVDQRSDIFSLGVVLYEMLTGHTPFNADSPLELMSKVVEARIPDLVELDGEIDPALYSILKVMLASEPKGRYSDCQQLIADLDDYLAGQSPRHAASVVPEADAQPLDDESATVAMSTPPAGQLPKQAPPPPSPAQKVAAQPQPSGGGRLFLFAALVGVLVLGTVSAASWWAIQHYSLPLPGFSQRSEPANSDVADSDGTAENAGEGQARDDADQEAVATVQTEPDGRALPLTDASDDATSTRATQDDESMAASGASTQDDSTSGQQSTASSEDSSAAEAIADSGDASAGHDDDNETRVADDGEGADADDPLSSSEQLASVTPPVTSPEAGSSDSRPAEQTQEQNPAPRTEPVEPEWDPSDPRVAVVVSGERMGAVPLQARLERRIADAGFRLFDADLVDMPGGSGLAGFARALRDGGADVLIFVEIEPAGQSQLSYYGRQDTLYIANVAVRAVQLHDNQTLGPRWQDSMRYTELNAEEKAAEIATPLANEVLRRLRRMRRM